MNPQPIRQKFTKENRFSALQLMEEGVKQDSDILSSERTIAIREQPSSSKLNSTDIEPSNPNPVSSQQLVLLGGRPYDPGPLQFYGAELPSNQNVALSPIGL